MTSIQTKIKLLSQDENNNLLLNPRAIKTLQANKEKCGKVLLNIQGCAR